MVLHPDAQKVQQEKLVAFKPVKEDVSAVVVSLPCFFYGICIVLTSFQAKATTKKVNVVYVIVSLGCFSGICTAFLQCLLTLLCYGSFFLTVFDILFVPTVSKMTVEVQSIAVESIAVEVQSIAIEVRRNSGAI